MILANIRDPESLLAALRLDGLIDFAQPIGLLCTAVLQFAADTEDPEAADDDSGRPWWAGVGRKP